MKALEYDKDHFGYMRYGDSFEDRVLARTLAELTVNWGRVEYGLYLCLHAIDQTRADEWTQRFFKTVTRKRKEETVRDEIIASIHNNTELLDILKDALDKLQVICDQRNGLAHGLWKMKELGKYEIQPLYFDGRKGEFADAFNFDAKEAARLLDSIYYVIDSLAHLTAGVMASMYLQSDGK